MPDATDYEQILKALAYPPTRLVQDLAGPVVPVSGDDERNAVTVGPYSLPDPPDRPGRRRWVHPINDRLDDWLRKFQPVWDRLNGPARTFAGLVALELCKPTRARWPARADAAVETGYRFLAGDCGLSDWQTALSRTVDSLRLRSSPLEVEDPEGVAVMTLGGVLQRTTWQRTEAAVRTWWKRVRARLALRDAPRPMLEHLQINIQVGRSLRMRPPMLSRLIQWLGDARVILEQLGHSHTEPGLLDRVTDARRQQALRAEVERTINTAFTLPGRYLASLARELARQFAADHLLVPLAHLTDDVSRSVMALLGCTLVVPELRETLDCALEDLVRAPYESAERTVSGLAKIAVHALEPLVLEQADSRDWRWRLGAVHATGELVEHQDVDVFLEDDDDGYENGPFLDHLTWQLHHLQQDPEPAVRSAFAELLENQQNRIGEYRSVYDDEWHVEVTLANFGESEHTPESEHLRDLLWGCGDTDDRNDRDEEPAHWVDLADVDELWGTAEMDPDDSDDSDDPGDRD